ncbi:MAG TPA: biotin/lipoyl-containing protein, partial [Burkholderiaceae bacterium]|nr:biotin/lipoyl-containing protein [Burkholderiaceae bacterium]
MALVEVRVPDIGDFKDVAVIELLVKPGDTVKAEQSLITVESDKASMEIPSSTAGVLKELRVKLGDKVSEGSVVAVLEAEGQAAAAEPAVVAAPVAAATATAAAPVAAAAGGGLAELRVPDIGDFKDVAVIEVFVKPGDAVKLEQSLITVESDKASMEIPASQAGVIKEVKVKLGDKVSQGSLVALVEAVGAAPAAVAAPAPSPAASASAPQPAPATRTSPTAALPPHEPTAPQGNLPHASPSVRRFARELGVPLDEVKGSGPNGRITHEDLQGFVKGVMAGAVQTSAQKAAAPAGAPAGGGLAGLLPWPQIDFTKFGPVERKDLS